MKYSKKGSFTIEAAMIVPLILLVFVFSIYLMFYYHDKNILKGAAYETAVVGSGRTQYEIKDLDRYFQRRIRGKLILFASAQTEIQIRQEEILVSVSTQRGRMKMAVMTSARRTEPEMFIRNLRNIEKGLGDIK